MISKYLISLFIITSTMAIECVSETREYVDSNEVRVNREILDVIFKTPQTTKLSADNANSSFNVTIEKEKITSIISLGPDYTIGTLVTGEFDNQGKFKHTLVGPTYTSILTCIE
ncbi:hypothetical protein [Bacteriovorax sp. Seq25_V]|uniref:hypothetical protein n=1 Tax=Bacteriovorax sp. Seq25_V TaxID=1201288 RepID=UPI000389E37F|nr:hypothetical protein [Bacteriovorax sp. Seq25_V]EQC44902.1 hypothetical protein M900_A0160 [Bacteriovorax sp. Seq25_V]